MWLYLKHKRHYSQLVYNGFLYGGPVDRTTASMMYWKIEHWNSKVVSVQTILSPLLGTSGLYLQYLNNKAIKCGLLMSNIDQETELVNFWYHSMTQTGYGGSTNILVAIIITYNKVVKVHNINNHYSPFLCFNIIPQGQLDTNDQ